MHCYAPNLEKVEGANWFGPVHLSIHLSPPPPQPQLPTKKNIFLDLDSLRKKNHSLKPPPPPPIFFFILF